jgi:hypothetical protein
MIFAGAVTAPTPDADGFYEIGKTSYATVSINRDSVQLSHKSDGSLIASMLVKVRLNTPTKVEGKPDMRSVVNATVFSCADKAAMVVASSALDEKNELIFSNEKKTMIPWVRASDSAVDLVMKTLCAGEKPPKKPGERDA